ncbi:MAG: PQQ-binding-like beta-propeller repeat protein, partial [Hyphomicrobiales bacterium]
MPRSLGTAALACLVQIASFGAAFAAETPWPAFGHDPSNRNFSELTQIDRDTVGRLRPAWIFQTGITGYFQAQPVMVDGTLYVSTTQNNVAALDART